MEHMIDQNVLDIIHDLPKFSERFLVINTKGGGDNDGQTFLKFNRAQLFAHQRLEAQLKETSKVRALILKGRQQGMSTMIAARNFHKVITTRGKKAFIMAHEGDATDNLFGMTRRYYDNLPEGLCPKATKLNMSELEFDQFNSSYRVGTAGNKKTGRSQTIQLFHGSEVGFWENTDDLSTGILQAVSGSAGTEVILESTANGLGNFFHKSWIAAVHGDSEYQAIFVPWYWQTEYTSAKMGFRPADEEQELFSIYGKDGLTLQHLSWRRDKMMELNKDPERAYEMFKQEYPFSASEAFLNPIANTFIKSKHVSKARNTVVDTDIGLIIGVDPAGDKDGADRTAIIRRRGRKVYGLETFRNHNTMEIAGIVSKMIREERPVKVYIDCIGIGKGVVDRLQELGYDFVEGINVANTAHLKERFANRRAELWSECYDWLTQDMPVQLPDSDELQSDLCSVGFKHRSNGQLVIESKDDLRKRGMPSCDTADALIHTFAGGFIEAAHAPVERYMEPQRGMFS